MKQLKILMFIIISSFFSLITYSQPCKEVIAYYPNWQWYDRGNLVNPTSIDYSKYSIINYSFFKPMPNGSITQTDSWADENLLFGQHDWANGGYLPNTSLIDIAHNNNVKVMVSIGGWTLSDNFPAIANDTTKRTLFASECRRLLETYNFDGIDLDWEYPGYASHNGTPADGVNFTLLVEEIRDSIDALGITTGKDYLLSSCFSADFVKMEIIEWSNLIGKLDMFNLMTYDFFGAWETLSNHNSPLYSPAVGNSAFNIDSAFYYVTQVHAVPASLVNIGVAFYGRSVTGCTGLHQTNSGSPDASTFWEDEGSPLYYNIYNKINQFTQYWDSQAQVPYLVGNSINTFVSYDNKQSVAKKAEYVINNNARGVIIWELTGDYIETSLGSGVIASTPLVDTLNYVLCSVPTFIDENITSKSEEVFVIQNPIKNKEEVIITIIADEYINGKFEIYSIDGKKYYSSIIKQTDIPISISETGIYFIMISNNEKTFSKKVIVN